MTKHLTEPIDDPRDVRPELSEGVAALIFRMMAKKAEDRHQTPEELIRDIRTVLRGRSPAYAPGAFAGAKRSARATGEHRRARARAISTRGRHSGVTGVLFAVGAVVAVGFVMVKLLSSPSRPASRASPRRPPAVTVEATPEKPERVSGKGSSLEDRADELAKALHEKAAKFAADPENAQKYPEIFRRFRRAAAAGEGSHHGKKAEAALDSHRRRQVNDRNKLIAELRGKARQLMQKGKFREAYALWGEFPNDLLPESGAAALAILDPEQKAVLGAARKRFDALIKNAHAKVASGNYRSARRLLKAAASIGIERVTSRLPAERRRLERAIAKHRAETKSKQAKAWRTRRSDILALAEAGDYEGARILARESVPQKQFRARAQELKALDHDMDRLAFVQELAIEGLEAQIGKSRVVVHKDGRGYSGTVTKVEGGRVWLVPARPGSKRITIMKQDLEPDDIRRHAPIRFSDAEGRYDYAILLVYSGKPKKARPFLERCLLSKEFGDKARWHLERIAE